MHLEQFLGFAAVSLALALVPGASWAYVISTTAAQGRGAGLLAVLGNAAGIACHVVAVAAGLSAVLLYSDHAFAILQWLGALYLVFLGVRTLRGPAATADGDDRPPQRGAVVFTQGVLVNLLNPKVALVMLALLPQFAEPAAGRVPLQILSIGMVHAVIASLVLTVLVLVTTGSRRRFAAGSRAARVLRAVAGLTLIGFGLRLALAGAL